MSKVFMTSMNMVLEMGPQPTFSLFNMDPWKNDVVFCWDFCLFSKSVQQRKIKFPSQQLFRFFISKVCHLQPDSLRHLFIVTNHRQTFGTVVHFLILLKAL